MSDDPRNRLAERLRAGDPAKSEAPLTRNEVLEIRRRTLSAIPEPRRAWLPVLVPLACGLLALAVAAALWPRREAQEARPSTPAPRVAVSSGPPSPEGRNGGNARPERSEPTPKIDFEPLPPRAAPTKPRGKRTQPTPRSPKPEIPNLPATDPQVKLAEAQPRQMQFATPGGTRVIWFVQPEPIGEPGR